MAGRAQEDPKPRFAAAVRVSPNGCWLWIAGTDSSGRGMFSVNGKQVRAYVWAWEYKNGPVPEGKVLDHVVCQNPNCVNPAHLQPVTQRINVLRGKSSRVRAFLANTCTRGHDLSKPENVYPKSNTRTGRRCRICTLEINRRSVERRKAG